MEEKLIKFSEDKGNPIFYRDFTLAQSLIATVIGMLLLVFIVYKFAVPNPNMILIAGLVICSAMFGYKGGIPAAIIMFMYTLYFFSDNNSFVVFSDENTKKVIVSLIGILVDMIFVCGLKRRERAQYEDVKELSKMLSHENELLLQSSMTDALTGINNRLALRRDFDGYLYTEVFVMMLDVDNFKNINDSYGHYHGDHVLAETAALIGETFGPDHCYRYGGDEFLIIVPGIGLAEFSAGIEHIMKNKPVVTDEDNYDDISIGVGLVDAKADRAKEDAAGHDHSNDLEVGYSIGFTFGHADNHHYLRKMIDTADECMYQAKRGGKNMVIRDPETFNS